MSGAATRNALLGSPALPPAAPPANALLGPAPAPKMTRRFPGAALQPESSPAPLQTSPTPAVTPGLPAPVGSPPAQPSPPISATAHPADDMGLLAKHLAKAKMPASQITAMVRAEDHIVQATGTLLKQPGDITQQDLNAALNGAMKGSKFDYRVVAQFAKSLPPISNQNALRRTLMVQRERSIRALVVLHAEVRRRGIQAAAVQNPALRSAVQ